MLHLLTNPYNQVIIKLIQQCANPWLDRFFGAVTMMGTDAFFIALAAVIFWCVDVSFGYRMVFAYMINGAINTVIKEGLRIPRPIGEPGIRSLRLDTAGGYSFPSGHAQMSASFWTSVMTQVRKRWVYCAGTMLILLVSLSRLYLGVHRPVDVAAGIALGVVWVLISNQIYDYAERSGRRWIMLLLALPVAAGCLFIHTATYIKVAGVTVGFAAGYLIERRYICFQASAPLWQQLVKLIIGLVVVLLIEVGLKALFPPALISDFLRYLLLGLWVTAGATWCFSRVKTHRSEL
jgi:membrane-associated phospholipid phosphatase